jgi:hypothetical protein
MLREKMTIKEATEHWVRGFNAIPQSLLVKAFSDDVDNFAELTAVTVGEYVWSNEHQGQFEVISIDYENETAIIEVDEEETEVNLNDLHLEKDDYFPMWGTMWTFEERLDEDWARENINILSQCGFRIYEEQENGDIYIGIDGAGYNFYDEHWIPLYRARGLHWHNEEEK